MKKKRKKPAKQAPKKSPKRPPYSIEFYETDDGDQPVRRWMKEELTPTKCRALGMAMNHVLQALGVDVCATEYGEALGGGLFEFRLRHDLAYLKEQAGLKANPADKEDVLLRVFCHAYGAKIIVLLGGYDKGEDSSRSRQNKEIEEARKRLVDFNKRKKE